MKAYTKQFNNGIMEIIERCSYDFYVIQRNLKIRCVCVEHSTDQADPNCPKCLGTGYKIVVRKVRGATQDTNTPPTYRADSFLTARNIWVPSKIKLKNDDLVVDGEFVYKILDYQRAIGLEGTLPYNLYLGTVKKFDAGVFMENFLNIVNRK